MIALDTNALTLLFVPGSVAYAGGSKSPIKYASERLAELINTASQSGDAILISTPVLSELLVRTPEQKIQDLLVFLKKSTHFRIEPFDLACAIELADRTAKAIGSKAGKRAGTDPNATWAKVKFDRQIMSIAIVNGATKMISNDADLVAIGKDWGLTVMGIEELPLPASLEPPPIYKMLEEQDEAPKE